MKVLKEGHLYELENLENDNKMGQQIQFIEKALITQDTHPSFWVNGNIPEEGTLYTVTNGTTNEEVLKMMVNRLQSLYDKVPSQETLAAIQHVQTALEYLEYRTKERVKRGVEGKAIV